MFQDCKYCLSYKLDSNWVIMPKKPIVQADWHCNLHMKGNKVDASLTVYEPAVEGKIQKILEG